MTLFLFVQLYRTSSMSRSLRTRMLAKQGFDDELPCPPPLLQRIGLQHGEQLVVGRGMPGRSSLSSLPEPGESDCNHSRQPAELQRVGRGMPTSSSLFPQPVPGGFDSNRACSATGRTGTINNQVSSVFCDLTQILYHSRFITPLCILEPTTTKEVCSCSSEISEEHSNGCLERRQ